jgi:lysine 2,3-aminomutase
METSSDGETSKPPSTSEAAQRGEVRVLSSSGQTVTITSSVKVAKRQVKKLGVSSPRSAKTFFKRFFPDATETDWNDWQWQVRNRFRDLQSLSRILRLSNDERSAIEKLGDRLSVAVTPYYASLLDPEDCNQPLRRTMIPVTTEFIEAPGESHDPLAEEETSPAPGLVHRYPDRVLFLATDFCSAHCRYCTRSRVVGTGEVVPSKECWEKALQYIEHTPAIRDVLVSGGDPLTMSDDRLEYLLLRLRSIRHVEIIRIGTKVPAVLPQRITPHIVRMLRKYHPLWMSLHFTHPDELTPETARACTRLSDAGIPLGSQTVLLRGINDNIDTMTRLYHGLLKIRVRPYYLYQCDPITGSSHFRTPVEKGLEIIEGLRGHTTGYAVPHFVIDAPGGGGKIALVPNAVVGKENGDVILRNFQGKLFRYPDYPVE